MPVLYRDSEPTPGPVTIRVRGLVKHVMAAPGEVMSWQEGSHDMLYRNIVFEYRLHPGDLLHLLPGLQMLNEGVGTADNSRRLGVLDVDDHLTGGGLVGDRAARLELQHVSAQLHLPLQLLRPAWPRLNIPEPKRLTYSITWG